MCCYGILIWWSHYLPADRKREVQIVISFRLCPAIPFVWSEEKWHGAQDWGKTEMKGKPSTCVRLLCRISRSVNMRERCCAAGKDTDEWKNEKVNTARKTNGTRRRCCGDDGPRIRAMEKFSLQFQNQSLHAANKRKYYRRQQRHRKIIPSCTRRINRKPLLQQAWWQRDTQRIPRLLILARNLRKWSGVDSAAKTLPITLG